MTIFYCLRFQTSPTWRARSPYLYPPGRVWRSYTSRHWVPFSSPSTTRRATVCRKGYRYPEGGSPRMRRFHLNILASVVLLITPVLGPSRGRRFLQHLYCCICTAAAVTCLPSRFLETAYVYLFISRSLYSNGSTRYTMICFVIIAAMTMNFSVCVGLPTFRKSGCFRLHVRRVTRA
jgi:hypothetical protein